MVTVTMTVTMTVMVLGWGAQGLKELRSGV
jgi:hypothetical protein